MPLIIPANTLSTGGYTVANSCRFNDGSSDYLSRTPGSTGNQKLFTYSVWIKRGQLGSNQNIFHEYPGSGQRSDIIFRSADTIRVALEKENANQLLTNRVFRDTSAYYHIVVVYDSDNATSGDRVKLYVNGVRETSFATEEYPDSGSLSGINTTGQHEISSYDGSGDYFDGYMAENVFIDGQALDPTSFGEFNSDSPTIWQPIDVSGLTFGTNGFYLSYSDSADLGADSSGNSNDFTSTNLDATDQCQDSPTNNFCTLNPLAVDPGSGASTLSNGNTSVSNAGSSRCFGSTLAVSKGKYYWEYKMIGVGDIVGARSIDEVASGANLFLTSKSFGVYYDGNSKLYINGSDQGDIGVSTETTDDIAMFALDCDNNKIYIGLNGDWTTGIGNGYDTSSFGSANDFSIDSNILWTVDMSNGSSVTTHSSAMNFGNPPYAITSSNADANGYGNFEFAVPSGYYALCTKNLAEYG